MARASAASLLLFLLQVCVAQSFGRFGYSESVAVPGLSIDKDGFTAKSPAADKFYFAQPAAAWRIGATNSTEQTIDLGTGDGPAELKVNLFAPGAMLRFPKGFALKIRSNTAPYLTWKDASVGEHVPTPNVRWICVSFRDQQPPLVFGFMDGEASVQIDGEVGDWTLRTSTPYSGWVRVALPVGARPFATDSAATLGKLSLGIAAHDQLWWQPTPQLLNVTTQDEGTAVETTWHFDRAKAVVPVGAALSNLGAYPLTFKTPVTRLDGYTEEGPLTVADSELLTIRFPIHRVPLGRALTVGASPDEPISTVSGFDVSGVVELALENLLAGRDMISRKAAEDTVNGFIGEVQTYIEPHTGQRLPYGADAKGIDAVAANALLYQAYTMSTKSSSKDNGLLSSLTKRRDWYTWRIWTGDQKLSRRAGALAAFAGALCPEPGRRLEAAMAQAGLAAERGLAIFMQRATRQPNDPTLLEPIWTIRNSIFEMAQAPPRRSDFVVSILGDLRVFGDTPVHCAVDEQKNLNLLWGDIPTVTLGAGFPLSADGDGVVSHQALGFTTITIGAAGNRMARLTLPPWTRPPPAFVAPPSYDEPVN